MQLAMNGCFACKPFSNHLIYSLRFLKLLSLSNGYAEETHS
jgi:hypothetical protein